MGKGQNVIEINGKRYDARSGRLLHRVGALSDTIKSIDGFTKSPHSIPVKITRPMSPHHTTPAQHVHKKTEKSKTLMRSAVKKPAPLHKATQANEHKLHTAIALSKPLLPTHSINPGRILRAGHIKRSHLVSKFGRSIPGALHIKTVPLPVQALPQDVPTLPMGNLTHRTENIAVPGNHSRFTSALANAHSHEQPKAKHRNKLHHRVARKLRVSTKALNITAGLTAVLLLAGFIAYQNVPNLAMRVATARSGVHGKFPDYQPSGFGLNGPIEYRKGQITISFKSNTDDRSFKVVQESSDWTSETLLSSLTDKGKRPLTLLKQGKTIYMYDGNNAAWVSGGIKYRIEGKAELSSDQLLRLATSL